MIDEYWTWIFYGYHSDDLSYGSVRPIIAVCDECYQYRIVNKSDYRELCRRCVKLVKYLSDNTRDLLSQSHIGHKHTESTKKMMSISMTGIKHYPITPERNNQKNSVSPIGNPYHTLSESRDRHAHVALQHIEGVKKRKMPPMSDDTRCRMSARKQGIPYEEWEGFVGEKIYCEKFDEACRERVRGKYDYRCFVCNKPQHENTSKNGNVRKLSVHHVDKNKDQGCNGVQWKLVPLCMHCHGKSHHEPLLSRLIHIATAE